VLVSMIFQMLQQSSGDKQGDYIPEKYSCLSPGDCCNI